MPDNNLRNKADQLLKQGSLKEAEEIYLNYLRKNSADSGARYNLSVIYIRTGRFADALSEIEQLLGENPDDLQALNAAGISHQALNNMQKAEQAFRKVLELDSGNPGAASNLGILLQNTGRHEEAEQLFRKLTNIEEQNPENHYNLGLACHKQKRYKEAEACYKRTLELKPDHFDAGNNLALLYQINEEYEESEKIFRQLLEQAPENRELLFNLANSLRELNRFD